MESGCSKQIKQTETFWNQKIRFFKTFQQWNEILFIKTERSRAGHKRKRICIRKIDKI